MSTINCPCTKLHLISWNIPWSNFLHICYNLLAISLSLFQRTIFPTEPTSPQSMNPGAPPNPENPFWISHLEISAFSSSIWLSQHIFPYSVVYPHHSTLPSYSATSASSPLLQPRLRWCYLPQPHFNSSWAAVNSASSLVWAAGRVHWTLYHHPRWELEDSEVSLTMQK